MLFRSLPIKINVIGEYHELGLFVSGLASLPRIVTVHNIDIAPEKGSLLVMNATIKTYNEDVAGVKKKKKGRRR